MFGGDSHANDREDDERKESKKDKDKGYRAFHSDDSDNFEEVEEDVRPKGKKLKREKSGGTLRLRIKSTKQKKKDKDKDKEKDKEKEKEKKEEKKKDKEKKKNKRSSSQTLETQCSPKPARNPVFGVPLEAAIKQTKFPDGIELPRVFREGILYIEDHGLKVEGIYRVPGSKPKIEELKELYDHGKIVSLQDYEPQVVSSMIKLYLRELPGNLLPSSLGQKFGELVGMTDKKSQLEKVKQLVSQLPGPNRTLLSWLFVHMQHVMDNSADTKMNLQNISIVLSPTLQIGHGVLFLFLNNVRELFPDLELVRYTGPLTVSQKMDEDEADLPSSPDAIAAALAKQEAILAQLHEDLNAGNSDEDEGKDEMLWEVQRKVTQLKRKLRVAKSIKSKQAEENKTTTELQNGEKKEDSKEGSKKEEADQTVKETKLETKEKQKVEHDEEDELIRLLEASEAELLLEQEELKAIGEELRKHIEHERREVERISEEIKVIREKKEREQTFSDPGSASDSSDSETEDEDKLQEILKSFIIQNEELDKQNIELCHNLHHEKETCAKLRVQIKILETKKRDTGEITEPQQQEETAKEEDDTSTSTTV